MSSRQSQIDNDPHSVERLRLPYRIKVERRTISGLSASLGVAFHRSARLRGRRLNVDQIVYGWFGYDDWSDLDSHEPSTYHPGDEECSAGDLSHRRRMQAEIAASGLGITLEAAGILIETLKPTSRTPSISQLRRLQQTLLNQDIPLFDEKTEVVIRDWAVRTGFAAASEEDAMKAVSTVVIRPKGYLDYLEDVFGWRITRVTPSNGQFLCHLGAGEGEEAPTFEIYMTPVIPSPLDRNALLGKTMEILSKSASNAVLLFNHPSMISRTPDADLLLGGLIFSRDRWAKFFLHPDLGLGRGLDGAFHQHSSDRDFLADGLAFSRASFLCECLTSLTIGERIGKSEFSKVRLSDGFTIFIPALVGERFGLG